MDLIDFYKKEVEKISITPIVTIIISAISQGLILTVIINATVSVSPDNYSFKLLLL
jgi:hypothetical protein